MGRWAPELASVQVLEGFDAAGAPRLRAPKRPITLRHLLTHTSGYGYGMWNEPLARYMEVTGLPGNLELRERRAAACRCCSIRASAGTTASISNWSARSIEAVSGKRLGVYLKENLFDPLGMDSTGFRITPSMRKRMARLHERGADDALTAGDFEVPQEPEFELGGGGLYSTAVDYLAFVRMILNRGAGNGNRVLKAETVELMSRNHMGELRVVPLRSVNPQRSNDAEFFPGVPKSWGLGFMINHDKASTGRSAGSLAWAGLSNCYFWIDPTAGVGGVYMTQILPFADVKSLPLFLDFETAVYRSLS